MPTGPIAADATLADVDEGRLLAAIFPSFAGAARDLVGPGDDAAVVGVTSGSIVATPDSMVRGRDWLDVWSSAADVAVKCLTQNLADVVAMGAVPTSLLLSLIADPATPVAWVADFARAMGAEAALHDVTVVGGDLSSAPAGT
ncbi:MAG: AIR synthase related protein, partial [Nostocoides sp.]